MQFRYLSAVAALTVLLVSARAWPCKLPVCEVSLLAPADGAVDVPLNARIWIGQQEYSDHEKHLDDPHLFEVSTGVEVPMQRNSIGGNSKFVSVYTPVNQLAPNTQYKLNDALTFTTGTTVDTTPPTPPTVKLEDTISEWKTPLGCGESTYGARYSLKLDGLIAVVDVGRTVEVPPGFGDLQVPGLAWRFSGDTDTITTFVGTGNGCVSAVADPGAETNVRFGSYDIAGNFSGYSDALPVEIPSCGCASGSVPGSALLLGLSVLGRRHRRMH